jgi:hypothetical protein
MSPRLVFVLLVLAFGLAERSSKKSGSLEDPNEISGKKDRHH